LRENREISSSPTTDGGVGRIGKVGDHKPMMHDEEKSDRPIVPAKHPNKAGQRAAAEGVEGRGLTKGNAIERNADRTQSRTKAARSELDRVRERARQDKEAKFTALLHHVTVDRLRAAYRGLNRRAASGVDGVTWVQYGEQLEGNLRELHAQLHRGAYRARPSRRVFIPKADGRQRPLGIAALEDKIVQRATVEVLNAIYEEDFLGFSYGFRPGRGQHDALDALAAAITTTKVNWVLDADIRGFFDAIDHGWLVKFVEHRIGDRRVVRLVQKWLRAGVLEDGRWTASMVGSPQGATVSPLLANIYLHYVLDLWAHLWRRRKARGAVCIVRYADDFIVGFEHEEDGRRFLAELRGRLQRFGLELHPDKTRLIEFGRFANANRRRRGQPGNAETFSFLGFVHICGRTLAGRFKLLRHTDTARMRATLQAVKAALVRRRHDPVPDQGAWLGRVVRGYLGYYAVPTNTTIVGRFRTEIIRAWCRQLRQRSQRHHLNWARMNRLATRWLPPARPHHPWPDQRFRAKTRGRSPVR
jgi:group II intron reverse transcriptase/maturase